jgi:hypothetical protein
MATVSSSTQNARGLLCLPASSVARSLRKGARMTNRAGFSMIVVVVFSAGACGSVSLAPDGGQAGADGSAGATGQGGAGQGGAGQGGAGQGGAGQGGGGQGGHGGAVFDGGADASDANANPCRGLTEAACGVTTGCSVGSCGSCSGGSSFVRCYQTATETPPPCPGFVCPPLCAGLTEAACVARPDCRTDYCPGCQQTKTYRGCSNINAPVTPCPALPCPLPCAMVTTLDQCETRTDCHSVFVDPGTCGCSAVGCCEHFSRCADGDKAKCSGMPLCRIATPFCEGTFVVSYTDTCYEGCVQKKDCAP